MSQISPPQLNYQDNVDKFESGYIPNYPWRLTKDGYEACSLEECSAVAIHTEFCDGPEYTLGVLCLPDSLTEEARTISSDEFLKLNENDVKILAKVLKDKYGFCGQYSISKESKNKVNFWKEPPLWPAKEIFQI